MSWQFEITLQVRDYELDLLGMVNNGVYQGYLEHARHEFLRRQGLDFAHLHAAGIRLVVVRAELDYLNLLQSGEEFTVMLNFKRHSRIKFLFEQRIEKTDGTPVLQAMIYG